ncbi:hypothetical protein TNCV_2731061 [Trichonephila clavipes]|nr:hypothetical protein TNCV_2731061 [Trichonephila clavipes]
MRRIYPFESVKGLKDTPDPPRDFYEVSFLPDSVARVAVIVGDHRCHTPRHLFTETLDVFLRYSRSRSSHTLPKLI